MHGAASNRPRLPASYNPPLAPLLSAPQYFEGVSDLPGQNIQRAGEPQVGTAIGCRLAEGGALRTSPNSLVSLSGRGTGVFQLALLIS